ncbi:ATP-dependent DNA helicase RecG [Chloroflexota bacterium]
MSLNTEALRKILELEHQKGYNDSAVIGGLDKFLRGWTARVQPSIASPKLLTPFRKLLDNPDYASKTAAERQEWASDVLKWLSGTTPESEGQAKAPPKTRARPPAAQKRAPAINGVHSLDSSITIIKGISSAMAGKFNKLGVQTIRDLLYFFPHRHLDYSQRTSISQLVAGVEQTIIANVWQAYETRPGGRKSTEAVVGDDTGNVRVVWFNNPYLAKKLSTNTRVVLSGKVTIFGGRPVFESPEWELVEDKELVHTGRLVPLYSLTQGLRSRQVRKLMKEVVDQWAWQVEDFLPENLKERCHLLDLPQAISQAHFPEDEAMKDNARVRLAFDELFLLQLGVLSQKRDWQASQPSHPLAPNTAVRDAFTQSLPFTLTGAQQRVVEEILADIQKSQPMCRLLQGEVGSGKTVVAAIAILIATANGYQGAFMAPTEILAEQHFNTICQLLSTVGQQATEEAYLRSYSGILPHPLTVALLISDVTASRKQEIQQRLQDGQVDIIIGTHALIQKGVEFSRLGVAIIDEQHRFGVEQRSSLREKGANPHMLVMTATPIPRTLALTLYGDLDLSVIDELPPGREPIKTKWLQPRQRESAYSFLHRQVAEGRQAFIICPLVEESEAIQARAAIAEYERLSQEVFPQLRLGLLHGRMSAKDKDKVMRLFHAGELDILVSTPVVEVGIDVPNATVMLVESADRFGLSQLHQFRGRVGRGEQQSYCMLLAENPSLVAEQRLSAIESVQDGFQLAEEDLRMRGPGEFFGTRQSGLPDLRMAKLSDVPLLELARTEAIRLFEEDPRLNKAEHRLLTRELARVWRQGGEWS